MVSVHKLSHPQLQRLIRERSADPGAVFLTTHCRLRMRQRQVTLALLLDVLRQGRMRRPAEPDPRHGSLVCRMEYFVAGRQLAAAVALSDDDPGVLVVTVIDLEE
jgi:hypothetical protein